MEKTIHAATLEGIAQATDDELNMIVHAVIRRYTEPFPNSEITFLSLPKHAPEERRKILDSIFTFLRDTIRYKKWTPVSGSPNSSVW